jgi:hypothetical protein
MLCTCIHCTWTHHGLILHFAHLVLSVFIPAIHVLRGVVVFVVMDEMRVLLSSLAAAPIVVLLITPLFSSSCTSLVHCHAYLVLLVLAHAIIVLHGVVVFVVMDAMRALLLSPEVAPVVALCTFMVSR